MLETVVLGGKSQEVSLAEGRRGGPFWRHPSKYLGDTWAHLGACLCCRRPAEGEDVEEMLRARAKTGELSHSRGERKEGEADKREREEQEMEIMKENRRGKKSSHIREDMSGKDRAIHVASCFAQPLH